MKTRTNPNTKAQFKEAISYIKESANYIYFSIALFFLSAILGFLFRDNLTFLNQLIKQLILKTQDLNTPEMVLFILQNNFQSSLFALGLGILFGIFPLISIITNGAVLGYVLGLTYETSGISSWWRLFPHGIFELPAIFIALGLGLKLGFTIFSTKTDKNKEFHRRFYNSINVFLMIIIPLLIIAAIIEGILIGFLS